MASGGGVAPRRLISLDALRGFNMFFITGGEQLLIAISVFLTGDKMNALAYQMHHANWVGFRFYDLIFPLFLFVTGVTFPFSLARRRERGETNGRIALVILRRVLLLIGLGLIRNRIWMFDWDHYRVWSVIGRIGLAWGAATLLYLFCRVRTQVAAFIAVLVCWWLFWRYVPAPGAPAGVNPFVEPRYAFAHWMDINYLTTAHRVEGGFAVLGMMPTALLGVWAGAFLRLEREWLNPWKKAACLVAAGAVLSGIGVLWSLPADGCAIAKDGWSSAFVLVAGGCSLALLGMFYLLIDVWGFVKWSFFFRVIGMNTIVAFMLPPIMQYGEIGKYFTEPLFNLYADPIWMRIPYFAGFVAMNWLVLYFLYRHKIFFKT